METRPGEGVSEPSEWGRLTAPDDAAELDDLAAEMEWERWRSARRRPPWRIVVFLAAAVVVAIVSLALLIVLGHAGWTPDADVPRRLVAVGHVVRVDFLLSAVRSTAARRRRGRDFSGSERSRRRAVRRGGHRRPGER